MANNKIKTNKAAAKRIKLTARGKMKRYRPGAGHLKSKKSASRIRRFRKQTEVSSGFTKHAKRLLGQ
jgi:large subunit ribosomal protein L35